MSSLKNVERIDYTLFTTKDGDDIQFSVNSTILLGKKGQEDVKLDPVYINNYKSSKYSNKTTLDQIKLSVSSFITFSYTSYEDKKNIINEEVFISYPHLASFREFIAELYDIVLGDMSKKIFNKRCKINADYADVVVESEELGGGKKLYAVPTPVQKDEESPLKKGLQLFINNEDYFVELDESAIASLVTVLEEMNFLTLAQTTLLMGMMAGKNANNSSDDDEEENTGRSSKLKRRASVPPRRSGLKFKSSKKSNVVEEDEDEPEVEQEDSSLDFDSDDEDEHKIIPKRKAKAKPKAKVVVEEDEDDEDEESTSYKELMKEADKVEYEEDDELDFDQE